MSNRLYVGNLSFHTTGDVLRSAFAEVGEVTDVHVVMDRATGQSRGFGFVTMADATLAQPNQRITPAVERLTINAYTKS